MSLDRFVYWKDKRPKATDVGKVLRNFIGESGKVTWTGGRWFCTFPGKPTHPLKDVPGFPQEKLIPPRDDERWFEVYCADDNIDIITRMQDEFTNAVALGFQDLCARIWEGKLH